MFIFTLLQSRTHVDTVRTVLEGLNRTSDLISLTLVRYQIFYITLQTTQDKSAEVTQ